MTGRPGSTVEQAESFGPTQNSAPTTVERAERGVSLLEMVIVMTLLSLFITVVHETVISGLRVANSADEREDIRLQLGNALDRLTREATMTANIEEAADTTFEFDADTNGDGAADTTGIIYQENGTTGVFERTQGGTTVTLVKDLTSLEFDYFLNDGTEYTGGAGAQNIRLMQITITATNDDETISMAGSAYLHNMNF